jgi:phosphoglycerate dehydrogenase-like enzyme
MVESDVVFTNSAGVHAVPVAEHALAMMLYFARGLDLAERARRERRWAKDELQGEGSPVTELGGATVVIVGFGGIGRELGRRCRALGMRVSGVRRRPGAGDDPDAHRVVGPDGLDAVLGEADYVVLTVPHTRETDGLFDARRLARIRRGGVLINICRGRIVDEAALRHALRAGALRGAGLDVFAREPLPEDSPWWDEPRACVTPHTSSVSPHFWDRESELIRENVRRYRAGEPLRNVVDKSAGY